MMGLFATGWLISVLALAWLIGLVEKNIQKRKELKRNEEIHRMLVSDIIRNLSDIDSDNTSESGLSK